MKRCKVCEIDKDSSEFRKLSASKDGLGRECRSCANARDSQYRISNPEKLKESRARYRAANVDALKRRKQKYHMENAENIKASVMIWRSENPEAHRANTQNRRARELKADGSHSKRDVQKLFVLQRNKCASCNSSLKKGSEKIYHVDHIVALSKGGSNWPSNLQLLCPTCNLRKSAKDPLDWANENGKLL